MSNKNYKIRDVKHDFHSIEELSQFLKTSIYKYEYDAFLFAHQIKSGTDGSIKDLCLKLHEWYNKETKPVTREMNSYGGMPSVPLIFANKEANNFGIVVLFGAVLTSLKIESSIAIGIWNGSLLPFMLVPTEKGKRILLHGEREIPFNPEWTSFVTKIIK